MVSWRKKIELNFPKFCHSFTDVHKFYNFQETKLSNLASEKSVWILQFTKRPGYSNSAIFKQKAFERLARNLLNAMDMQILHFQAKNFRVIFKHV